MTQQWEHHVDVFWMTLPPQKYQSWHNSNQARDYLATMENEGWELFQVLAVPEEKSVVYYWKRPKEEHAHA